MRRELLSVLVLAALAGCPGGDAGIGDSCSGSDDCAGSAQCLNGRCEPRCQRAPDCGDGYACAQGACVAAHAGRGDSCQAESDCIAGLTCQINGAEVDTTNRLVASCQQENTMGRVSGAACDGDEDCRDGACDLGHCVDLCRAPADCATGTTCMTIPRVAVSGLFYSGCLPDHGILAWPIPVTSSSAEVLLPVTSVATAAELVMSVDDPGQKVGAESVLDPCGCTRYTVPCNFLEGPDAGCTPVVAKNEYYSQAPSGGSGSGGGTDATSTGLGGNGSGDTPSCGAIRQCDDTGGTAVNHIRHLPALARSVLLVPSSGQPGDLTQGAYRVQVSSFWPNNTLGTAVPHVTAVVRMGFGDTLDLHFFFLDLSDHPCAFNTGNQTLTAATAQTASFFHDDFLASLTSVFSHNGFLLRDVSYEDVQNRHALDGLDVADLGELFSLGSYATGINVFFVRSLSPLGVEVSGPNPGPAGIGGSPESGIVVSLDAACYRDWPQLGRLVAHALARYMGLYHNVEPRDPGQAASDPAWQDLIPDSDDSSSNLMYFSSHDGTDLSVGQRATLTRSPVLE